MTLRDVPYRARSLGGGAQVVVNLADHAAQIASSSVGPRRRRRWGDARRLERGATGTAAPRAETRRAVSSPEVKTEDLLRAAVTTDVDGLWQVRPRRLLEYSPGDLHTKGWFPWPSAYHLSVTVFASPELHAQTLFLAAWTASIHVTGLGVDDDKQSTFKAIFGTAYLGSLASMGVIIALVLGLFISLVVQRWWDVRVQYATFHHALLELAVAFAADTEENDAPLRKDATRELFRLLNLAHVLFLSQAGEREHAVTGARRLRRAGWPFSLRDSSRPPTPRAPRPACRRRSPRSDGRDARGASDALSLDVGVADDDEPAGDAKRADAVADDDEPAGDAKRADAVADDDEPAGDAKRADAVADDASAASPTTPRTERPRARRAADRQSETTTRDRATVPSRVVRGPSRTGSVASTAVFADDANILSKHVTHLDRDDCVALGLVTEEEWEALRAARAAGLPRFVAVLCWAHRLLERCAASSLCGTETKRAAVAKLADARQAAGRVSTYLASQLPYTYVNLVSLVVHVYLFVLATWFGFILHSGLNAAKTEVVATRGGGVATGDVVVDFDGVSETGAEPGETTSDATAFFVSERRGGSSSDVSSDVLTVAFCYAFLAFSNVLFQGLLHIHALLDNPFGHHPAKFPLRQFVAQLVGQTSALLAGAHAPPAASPSVALFRARRGGEDETDETDETEETEETEETRAVERAWS